MTIGWQSSIIGAGVPLGQVLGGFALPYTPKAKYQTTIASCLAFAFVTSSSSISQRNHAACIILGVLGVTDIGFVDNISPPGAALVVQPQDIGLAGQLGFRFHSCSWGAIAQALYESVLQKQNCSVPPRICHPAAPHHSRLSSMESLPAISLL